MNGADSREVSSRWLWLRSRWLPTALAVVPAVLMVWAASPPGGYSDIALLAFGGWFVAGMLWLIVAIRAIVALSQPRRRHIGALWPLLSFPALLIGIFLLTSSGMINRAMFEMHRPGLERLVADVAAAPNQRLIDHRVGLFTMSNARVNHTTGCTMMTVNDAGLLDSTGFAYCPGQPPVDDAHDGEGTTYENIGGAWYTFSFVW